MTELSDILGVPSDAPSFDAPDYPPMPRGTAPTAMPLAHQPPPFNCQPLGSASQLHKFFQQSGIRTSDPHRAILVADGGTIRFVYDPRSLRDYPADTICAYQWHGKERSLWFSFTVAQFVAHCASVKRLPNESI